MFVRNSIVLVLVMLLGFGSVYTLGDSPKSGSAESTTSNAVDSDGDGVDNLVDNCLNNPNTNQLDVDGDNYGNACDADFDNNCVVNFVDVAAFSDNFLTEQNLYDMNGDGFVNFVDLSALSQLFLLAPGPSGLTTQCSTPPTGDLVQVIPGYYNNALRNPMKGFTAGIDGSHEWATLSQRYIKWNELENDVSDGLERILAVSNQKFGNANEHNIKVIPRVYLHWNGADEKYWPADMNEDDYTSQQFQERALRLIDRLGQAWNDDPRVAFIELGIFGKWGEHHSPDPTDDMQSLVGGAFKAAFPDKLVSVRHVWEDFEGYGFGEYWDSWAHQQQMWGHGVGIAAINEADERYKHNYIGGEVAYNWGSWQIQPGQSPTDSVSDPVHRDFIENSIRWLHGTQLRWIANYDDSNSQAQAGAEILQRTMGYRFALNEVSFTPTIENGTLRFVASITNEGSAPFYYNWPVQLALHDPVSRSIIWSNTLDNVDIRTWMPGSNWTEPEWVPSDEWPGWVVAEGWSSLPQTWGNPPQMNVIDVSIPVNAPQGEYVLSISILDPASMQPSLRFATSNYWNGGRHPIGRVAIGQEGGGPLGNVAFDNPKLDDSISY